MLLCWHMSHVSNGRLISHIQWNCYRVLSASTLHPLHMSLHCCGNASDAATTRGATWCASQPPQEHLENNNNSIVIILSWRMLLAIRGVFDAQAPCRDSTDA
jgi:hypothetical protein